MGGFCLVYMYLLKLCPLNLNCLLTALPWWSFTIVNCIVNSGAFVHSSTWSSGGSREIRDWWAGENTCLNLGRSKHPVTVYLEQHAVSQKLGPLSLSKTLGSFFLNLSLIVQISDTVGWVLIVIIFWLWIASFSIPRNQKSRRKKNTQWIILHVT